MRKRLSIALALGLLAFSAPPALAQEAASDSPAASSPATSTPATSTRAPTALSEQERDRQAESIARSIMSPFCPGRTVSACPNAGPWRDDIRKWVGEGVPAEDIRKRLAARVPKHNLRGAPMNHYSWVIPVALTLLGLGLLAFLLRYLVAPRREDPLDGTGGASDVGDPGEAPRRTTEDWDARLDQELDSLEG